MLQTLIVVVGIALADSVNPSTIAPALLFATSERPAGRVLEFAAGAFVANVAAGALLVLGPGQWLLSSIPHPSAHSKRVAELVIGLILLCVALVLWSTRARLARSGLGGTVTGSRTAFTAGATIMLVELPTAVPYFAAIAAIVAWGHGLVRSLLLVVIFNAVFLGPLFAIAVLVRSERVRASMQPFGAWLARNWAGTVAILLTLLGVLLASVGGAGLA